MVIEKSGEQNQKIHAFIHSAGVFYLFDVLFLSQTSRVQHKNKGLISFSWILDSRARDGHLTDKRKMRYI